jgi:type I restriction enzyme R subunit
MKELQLQDKYLIHFLCERLDGLQFRESKANTVSDKLFLESDLISFLSETELNKDNYKKALKQFGGDEKKFIKELTTELAERRKDATNMAIFINNNKTFTFKGLKFHLFYPSGGEFDGGKLFDQNIFSVVQELTYSFKHQGKTLYTFRPDICSFVNGIFWGYSELKSNYNNQSAYKQGRRKCNGSPKSGIIG